jgi:hypothetical protein
MGYHVVGGNGSTMGKSVTARGKSRIVGWTTYWTHEPQSKTRTERRNAAKIEQTKRRL